MSSDARTRYTKQAITKSFYQLLEDKPIEKITVKEICENAEINRATFYRYYDNQYNLMEIIEQEMLNEIKAEIQKAAGSTAAIIRKMLELLYQHKDEWLILMGNNADPRIVHKIYDFFFRLFESRYCTDKQKLHFRFIVGGYSAVVEYWIKSGMEESPDIIASQLIECSHLMSEDK